MLDRQYRERRIVPEESGRQGRPFDRAGEENDGVEHEFFLSLFAQGGRGKNHFGFAGMIIPDGANRTKPLYLLALL
jgi:hypothetical protein